MVEEAGQSNYKDARIGVSSGLNIYNWRRFLKDYDIPILCEYIEFGFLLNIAYNILF